MAHVTEWARRLPQLSELSSLSPLGQQWKFGHALCISNPQPAKSTAVNEDVRNSNDRNDSIEVRKSAVKFCGSLIGKVEWP